MPKIKESIILYEFGCLGKEGAEGIHKISSAAFDYLKKIALSEGEDRQLLRQKSKSGQEVLQVQNYAGVILTPDGTQIEILPKIGRKNQEDKEQAREALLIMLAALGYFPPLETEKADIEKAKRPLLEIFIGQFLNAMQDLVKRGLHSDYVAQEDNLFFCKGKLQLKKQIQKNFVQKQRFYCQYDEFLLDRPENRLLKSALLKVRSWIRTAENHKIWRELQPAFENVPESPYFSADFLRLKTDQNLRFYDIPLHWSRLILEGFSPWTMHGKSRAFSLLFPMEAVFEAYVGKILRRQLKQDYVLKEQAQTKYLVTHKEQNWFRLKPDFLIKKDNAVKAILDAKWKNLDLPKDNGRAKYDLSQADFYQMFAYGHSYFEKLADPETEACARKMFLIYPAHDSFEKAPECFSFQNASFNLKLWILPCKIGNKTDREGKILFPESAEFTEYLRNH